MEKNEQWVGLEVQRGDHGPIKSFYYDPLLYFSFWAALSDSHGGQVWWYPWALPVWFPLTDLFKCTVQMEADLTPFCCSWSVNEYLVLCGRPFLHRHLGCVKPAKGSCPMLGFNGVSECPFRSFYTLAWTPVIEGCARVLALFGALLLLYSF